MPILYTAVGYASWDISCSVIYIICVHTGYTNNDINLGCTTVRKIVLSAFIRYRIVLYASSVCTQPLPLSLMVINRGTHCRGIVFTHGVRMGERAGGGK